MMASLLPTILFALEGDWADFRAVLVVIVSVVVLIGSVYMLLASNFGARLGYLIMMVSLMIFMIIFSGMWLLGAAGTAPGTGPRGREPAWIPFKADSELGREDFQQALNQFPAGWDDPGEIYPGNIDSVGELDTVKTAVQEALARDAAANDLPATDPKDWQFRLRGSEVLTEAERAIPEADVRYRQEGDTLLFGVTIPATDKHREVTVYAYRNKGLVFLYALYFFVGSIILLVIHTILLGRYEREQNEREAAQASV